LLERKRKWKTNNQTNSTNNALEVAESLLDVVVEPFRAHGVEQQKPHENVPRLLAHRKAGCSDVGRCHPIHQVVPATGKKRKEEEERSHE
jgi:hypothetical protein